VAFGGSGVGRHEGCAVFVPGSLVGERVRVVLVKCRKRFAEAALLEVLTPSEHRIESACSLSDLCPGCSYQHVSYAEEVRLKQSQLEGLLKRIGGLEDVTFKKPIASPRHLGYRNKIVLHAQRERKLGYFGNDNRTVVDVPACPLAVQPINDELHKKRANIKFMKGMRPNAGVTFRWTETDGAVSWIDRESGVKRLTEVASVGELRVPRRSFYQVNPFAGELLVTSVTEAIDAVKPTYLLDFYCGVGLFALAGSKLGVPHVLGVERQSFAVRAAIQNAKALGLSARFEATDAHAVADDSLEKVDCDQTMVIVDPPRQGLEESLVETLISKRPAYLVYVSCAPDTLARDLKLLTTEAYAVEHCQLVDMFPRTSHFETVAVLKSKSAQPVGQLADVPSAAKRQIGKASG
jgi:23S rRNA (uracil1939-C5)-methyltransferase